MSFQNGKGPKLLSRISSSRIMSVPGIEQILKDPTGMKILDFFDLFCQQEIVIGPLESWTLAHGQVSSVQVSGSNLNGADHSLTWGIHSVHF